MAPLLLHFTQIIWSLICYVHVIMYRDVTVAALWSKNLLTVGYASQLWRSSNVLSRWREERIRVTTVLSFVMAFLPRDAMLARY